MRTVHAVSLLVMVGMGSAVSADAEVEARADKIVRSSGVTAGLVVHLNCTDGKLTAALASRGRFVVHGLAATRESAEKAREYIASQGLHGRVSVEHGSFSRLPYVDDLVNLIVVDDFDDAKKHGLSREEVMRVLCPNGVAVLGEQEKIVKPRPEGMDEWTHWLHGPECNSLSSDSLVGPAGRLQWIAGAKWPLGVTRAAIFAGGRAFAVVPKGGAARGPRWMLVARDAYNGMLLWTRDIDAAGASYDPRLLVAVGGRVFTVLKKGDPLIALDAASGETVKTYDVGISPQTVLHHAGHLILGTESEITSVNAETGAVRWKKSASENAPFRYQSAVGYGRYPYVVLGGGRLFVFIEDAPTPPFSLVCYDAATGVERWRKRHPGEILKHYEGVLALLNQPEEFSWKKKVLGAIRGVSTEDGRMLWEQPNVTLAHADATTFCTGGLYWANVVGKGLVGLDPATGAEKKRLNSGITGHCGFVRTTPRYFIGVYDNLIDRETGKRLGGTWAFKNTCFLGNVPANGLLYNSPVYCGCSPYLRGFIAFAPTPVKPPDKAGAEKEERLEKGAGYGVPLKHARFNPPTEWNTYRHDAERSGSTTDALPRDLKVLWSTSVTDAARTPDGRSMTPPVVAEGEVFVATPDAHQVCALDAKTGEVRWRYLLDSRVEVAPTIHQGLCLFGANDGSVYCLRASDGEVVWRFRAAPRMRRIMVRGRLESPWPVPGVLVRNGVAYFTAGRHSGIEDGIFAYAVDPFTGKVLWQKHVSVRSNVPIKRKKTGWSDRILANELLVAGGDFLFMGRLMFDPKSGDLGLDWREERFLRSGNARSGTPLIPFGLLYDRMDAVERSSYHSMRYQLTFWSYGGAEGLLLAFTPDRVFGVTGKRGGKTEWELFSRRLDGSAEAKKEASLWSVKVPAGTLAMLSAGERLFVAGPGDETDPRGGMLWSYSAADGSKLSQLRFGDTPIFDGLAAADGRLYVATQNGKVFCFGKR